MKKITFITLLAVFATLISQAQMSIGVRGAISGSTVTKFDLIENITPDFNMVSSGSAALFMEIPLSARFSFQPELAFQQKGFNVDEGISAGGDFLGINIPVNGDLDFRTTYFEVPLLAKIHLGDKNSTHAYLMAGPSIGFITNATARVRLLSVIPLKTDVNQDFFRPLDVSAVAAAGFEVPFTEKVKGFAEVRYQHGFTRIVDTNIFEFDVRNRTLSGGLGLRFLI